MGIRDKLRQGYESVRDHPTTQRVLQHPAAKPVVATAGLMVGMAAGGFGAAKKVGGANFFVVIGALLAAFDVVVQYKGFNIIGLDLITVGKGILSLGYIVGTWALFFLLVSKDKSPKVIASYVGVIIALMFSIEIAIKYNPIAIAHVGYILMLWFFFVRGNEGTIRSNNLLLLFLFVDLYCYSFLNLFSESAANFFVGFPFLFIATNVYVWEKAHNFVSIFFLTVTFAWFFLMGGPHLAKSNFMAGVGAEVQKMPFSDWGEFGKISKQRLYDDPIKKVSKAVSDWVSVQIQYAVTGKVEENKREPLGVYLEDVKPADPRYYEDEDVIVWGTVKAKTLDDPINIKVGCFAVNNSKKVYSDKTDPEKKFSVFDLEEKDFACTFKGCNLAKDPKCESAPLKKGLNVVTTFAEFNFETLAYLKTYFINRERQRAMVREGQDVFDAFAIQDKNPVAIYTNGPAKIEMGTNSPLVSVSEDYIVEPSLDIKLSSREGWEGRINQLTELVLFLPDGADLAVNENKELMCGNKKFLPYREMACEKDENGKDEKCKTCTGSCNDFVVKECNEVCEGFKKDVEKVGCRKNCAEQGTTCNKVCHSLFAEGSQIYKGYALDTENIKVRDELKDFEKGKLFRCAFRPNASKVLGDAPITTKFAIVKARYNYTVEKAVNVKIEGVPEKEKEEIIKKKP